MIEIIHPNEEPIAGLPRIWDEAPNNAIDVPIMFEDEGQEDMGDSLPHSTITEILNSGMRTHLANQPHLQVLPNMNLYYDSKKPGTYVSPDVMIVVPVQPLPETITSYRIGKDGPAPLQTTEVLSPRTAQQGDLTAKPKIYAANKVAEYLLVDPSGEFLKERLLIRRLQADGTWLDSRDADGGVTSALGFRVVIEEDGKVRVINAATGRRYPRPLESESRIQKLEDERLIEEEARRRAEEARREAEDKARIAEKALRESEQEKLALHESRQLAVQKVKELEAELAQLRKMS